MTDKEKVAIRERAKKEMEVLDIYVDEAYRQLEPNADFTRLMLYACTAYLSAGLTDIYSSVEGLYGQIVIGE
ncbi:hypothetical protein [Streptococcus porcinus]|uniref:Uncharacterized protein n=1 Tax=Streptococcus porcinus TaxID=1340 RepID=A0A7V9WT35_STRPO|nr:hypothetical protein [Streptococcus porcinus]MBA2796584.1 hypothetical protein [Streptococcus porcinus]